MKGLVIDEPWIGKILGGEKTWEMRTSATEVRGRIALIRKGSGQVVGVAEVVDSIGPLDDIACRAHRDKHRIPPSQDEALLRWNHAWVLENALPMVEPVAYRHPNGAVIWVRLPDDVVRQMVPDFGTACRAGLPAASDAGSARTRHVVEQSHAGVLAHAVSLGQLSMVPVAKCGSWFGPHLARRGRFTVGAKGEEESHTDYAAALAALRAMPTPRWRRPNPNGNWGIVAGIRWCRPDELPGL